MGAQLSRQRKKEFAGKAVKILAGRRTFTLHTFWKQYEGSDCSLFLRLFHSWVNRQIRLRKVSCLSRPLAATKRYEIVKELV